MSDEHAPEGASKRFGGPVVLAIGAVGLAVLGFAVWWSMAPPPLADAPDVPLEVDPLPPRERPVAMPEPGDAPAEMSPEELEARAAELAGEQGVVCRIEPTVHGGTARLVLDDDDGTWLAVAAATAHVLVLSDIPEDGSGTVLVEGFAPTSVRWIGARAGGGRCEPEPLQLTPPEAAVVGTVSGPLSGLGLTACGQRIQLDQEGGFYAAAVPGEPCVVEARRHFGVWEWNHHEEVVPKPGIDTVVSVRAPGFEAVLPLVIEDGAVQAVWGPAPEPDLTGARVVAVDGEPVPADADGFHLATGGADGEVAEVEVMLGTTRHTVELARRALGFEDWLAH